MLEFDFRNLTLRYIPVTDPTVKFCKFGNNFTQPLQTSLSPDINQSSRTYRLIGKKYRDELPIRAQ